MKKVVALVVLVAMVLMMSGCAPKGKVKIAGVWVDQSGVDKMKNAINNAQARDNGDTYCKRCDKFMEGRVKICKYCGKYI